jgi:GNAT superfamily N-acetyltransferase
MALTFRLARLDDPEVATLLSEYEAELLRQGVAVDHGEGGGVQAGELSPPKGSFLLVDIDGSASACGGVRLLKPGVGEVKRVYVVPHARRRGVGADLLARLEQEALGLGCKLLRLDTGPGMEAALALYRGRVSGRSPTTTAIPMRPTGSKRPSDRSTWIRPYR